MSSDSYLFQNFSTENSVILYEAKMFHQFDHRWATYQTSINKDSIVEIKDLDVEQKNDPFYTISPRYWVNRTDVVNRLADRWDREWIIVCRKICRASDERTSIFSLLPKVATGDSALILFPDVDNVSLIACLHASLNSLVFDFVIRQKLGGTNLGFFILKQLPVLPPDRYSQDDINYITPRVLELTYTAWDIKPFADDLWNPTPTRSQSEVEVSNTETDSILTQASDKKQLKFALDIEITGKKQLELTTPPDPTHQTHLRQLILKQWQANRAAFEQDALTPQPPLPRGEQGCFKKW